MRKQYCLYFLYDGDQVVYIGVTKNLKTRIASHRDKVFNSVRVERFQRKADAMHNERMYTIRYVPKYSWIPPHVMNHPEYGKLVVAIKEAA